MIASTSQQWHFSRPALAQAYLTSLNLGLSSARGLFDRRRMGKTEFLVQDFMPAAQAGGYWAKWNEDNQEAISAYNERTAKHGLPLTQYRSWGQLLGDGRTAG